MLAPCHRCSTSVLHQIPIPIITISSRRTITTLSRTGLSGIRTATLSNPAMTSNSAVAISASISTNSTNHPRSHARKPKRFAPLDPALRASGSDDSDDGDLRPRLKGIVFDVDGTLCLPQNYMFREMRAALDIPKSVDILDHIRSLSNEPDPSISLCSPASADADAILSSQSSPPPTSPQAVAIAKVKAIENNAMTSQRPQPGLGELMTYLTRRGVRKALCTRNFPGPVHHLLDKYLPGEEFDPIITRETEGVSPKPSPEGLWRIAGTWGLGLDEAGTKGSTVDELYDPNGKALDVLELAKRYLGAGLIMVGDSIDDMASGHRAGAATVLLVNDENEELAGHEYTDLSIRRLDELIDLLDKGFEGRS